MITDKYILAFGCSYTIGHDSEDSEIQGIDNSATNKQQKEVRATLKISLSSKKIIMRLKKRFLKT